MEHGPFIDIYIYVCVCVHMIYQKNVILYSG